MGPIDGLEGKGAMVIGGGLGMGEATALLLASCGCDVAVVDIDEARAAKVAGKIEALGRKSTAIAYDVVSSSDHADLLATIDDAIPNLKLMATIVGMASWNPVLRTSAEAWDHDLRFNVRYFYLLARTFANRLVAKQSHGAIVAWSSVDGLHASPQHAPYGAAKAALISTAKSMAAEWAQFGIRVNTVAPGSISTPRRPETPEKLELMLQSHIPMRRSGQPHEVAAVAAFLLSDLSSYMTGQTLAVDGGWTIANMLTPVERFDPESAQRR